MFYIAFARILYYPQGLRTLALQRPSSEGQLLSQQLKVQARASAGTEGTEAAPSQ